MEAAGKWEGWDVGWWGTLLWELRKQKIYIYIYIQNGIRESFIPFTLEKGTQKNRTWKKREEGIKATPSLMKENTSENFFFCSLWEKLREARPTSISGSDSKTSLSWGFLSISKLIFCLFICYKGKLTQPIMEKSYIRTSRYKCIKN